MLSLSEAKPSMVKKQAGWVEIIVRACLEAMGEFESGEGESEGLESWLNDDVSYFPFVLCLWCFDPGFSLRRRALRMRMMRRRCMSNRWIGLRVRSVGGLSFHLLSR